MAIKSIVLVVFSFFFCLPGLTQSTLISEDIENFPEVKLQFNHRNPNPFSGNTVKVLENGKMIESFELSALETVEKRIGNKRILLLIENSYWPRFDEQRKNIKDLWANVAEHVVGEKDVFYLATFDWTKGEKTLNFLSANGVNNGQALNELIQGIEKPKPDGRQHQSTEIYAALREAISFLQQQKQSDTTAYAIVLFSSEFNNIFNNSQTKSDVIIEARKAAIPIYTFRYPYSDKYDLRDVSQATFGKHYNMNELTPEQVSNSINAIKTDCEGVDYTLSFSSVIAPDGNFRTLTIQLSNEDEISLTYQAPSNWSIIWKNPFYRSSLFVGLILLVVIAIWILQLKKKKKQEERKALEKIKEDTEKSIQENEQRQAAKQAESEQLMKIQQLRKLEEEILNTFNKLPRRPTLVAQNGQIFEINSPFYTIGRAEECSLQFENKTLSKTHAGIYFNCLPNELTMTNTGHFYLVDLGSTNGTLLNNKSAQSISAPHETHKVHSVLKNNDLIQMGELIFTFFE